MPTVTETGAGTPRHWQLSPLEAALDPDTPQKWLLEHPLRTGTEDDLAWYRAVAARRPLGEALQRRLFTLATQWRGPDSVHAHVVAVAVTLPRCRTVADLLDLADGLRWSPAADVAVTALTTHPECTEVVLARALTAVQASDGSAAMHAAAAWGSFYPYAWRLTCGSDPAWHKTTPRARALRVAAVAERIAARFPQPDTRRVAALAALTFHGPLADLAVAVAASVA